MGDRDGLGQDMVQSRLAIDNFPHEKVRLNDRPELVRAYLRVKQACAMTNQDAGRLPAATARAVIAACDALLGDRHDLFSVPLVTGGGGTTANMNVNEAVATTAAASLGAPVHPLDDVNAGQSSNDTYPTAVGIAVLERADGAVELLQALVTVIEQKAHDYAHLLRLGRTCLQDALPITAGENHSAQANAVRRAAEGIRAAAEELHAVPLGGTVIGTGFPNPPEFRPVAVAHLSDLVGRQLRVADNAFDALANLDPLLCVGDQIRRAGMILGRIASDLRLLASGPVGGFGEITIPELQAGSSIMPGKVNPVAAEYVMQMAFRMRGSNHTLEAAVAGGELELNIMETVAADSLFSMLDDLVAATNSLLRDVFPGLAWRENAVAERLAGSMSDRVAAALVHGYDNVATISRHDEEAAR